MCREYPPPQLPSPYVCHVNRWGGRAKIVSPKDAAEVLPIGHRGELAVSGYNVQKGYWNDPVRTAEVMIPDSTGRVWMHVGRPLLHRAIVSSHGRSLDGRRSGDGRQRVYQSIAPCWPPRAPALSDWIYIQITGRLRDLIIRGGENIVGPQTQPFFVCSHKHALSKSVRSKSKTAFWRTRWCWRRPWWD